MPPPLHYPSMRLALADLPRDGLLTGVDLRTATAREWDARKLPRGDAALDDAGVWLLEESLPPRLILRRTGAPFAWMTSRDKVHSHLCTTYINLRRRHQPIHVEVVEVLRPGEGQPQMREQSPVWLRVKVLYLDEPPLSAATCSRCWADEDVAALERALGGDHQQVA